MHYNSYIPRGQYCILTHRFSSIIYMDIIKKNDLTATQTGSSIEYIWLPKIYRLFLLNRNASDFLKPYRLKVFVLLLSMILLISS